MTAALVAAPRKDVHPGVREVQDPDFWGLPLHTPLTPEVKAAQKAKGFGGGPASRAAKAARGGSEGARIEVARRAQPSARDRIRNWFRSEGMSPEATRIIDGFDPRTFTSDQQAGQYALNRAKPGRFERAPHWSSQDEASIASDSITGFHEAQRDLRAGEGDSPQAKAFIARFNRNSSDTTDDLLVSRRVPVDAFPGGSTEGLAGKEVVDAGYFQGNLGTPIGSAPVLLTVAVPKGTRAMFAGNGPNDRGVILDRDQRLRITKVVPDGKGGWYVAAVAVPRSEVPVGKLEEGTEVTGAPSARAGGPGAPDLLERTPKRRPGFAEPRRFSEPQTHAAPSAEQRRLRTVQQAEEPTAIRQIGKLPDDIAEELNNPKITIARMREIAKEYDFKVPGSITKKVDVRDFLLGKQKEGPQPESAKRQLSTEAVAQLEDPKTTVAQLRQIAKDHGIKIPGTATRKADIRAHLIEVGDVRTALPDVLKSDERDDFRAGWNEVGKAPAGSAQRELNEIFIDVRGGRLGLLEGARRLDTSAELDREELDRVRGHDDKRAGQLEEEIAAKGRAAKFLRDYQGQREKAGMPPKPVPAPRKVASAKKVAKKAAIPDARRLGARRIAPLDPLSVYVDDGETVLRERLSSLSDEQLHDVVADYGMDPARRSARWDRDRLTDLIVTRVRDRATKGHAFHPPRDTTRALPDGPNIQVANLRTRTPTQIARGENLTPDGRRTLDSLGPAGHTRIAAIHDTEGKIREAYRMLAIPGSAGSVSIADLRKLIGEQVPRAALDEELKRLARLPDVRLEPQSYARENAATRIPAAVMIGGQEHNLIHIDDPTLARPVQFAVLDLADELDARRTGGSRDPMMALLSDADLQAEITRRVASDPFVARQMADRVSPVRETGRPLTEEQLRNIAQARGIHIPAGANKVEVAQVLMAGGGEMSGPGTLTAPVPHSTIQVRPVLAEATGPRTLARATQAEYKRITGRDLEVDFGPDPDLSLDTSREHMEGVLRAAESWPDTNLRRIGWFNGDLSAPGQQRPWAIGGNGEILFNTAYTSKANREQYLRELEAGIAGWDQGGSGFHPRGANTPAAVSMHEFGHLIAPEREARAHPGIVRHLQRRAREERIPPSRLIRREVSLYADANPSELVAEAVLDVLVNGDAAGRLSREIAELLRVGRL